MKPRLFAGRHDQYPQWRQYFINTYHVLRAPVYFKTEVLRDALDADNEACAMILDLLDCTPEGYRQAITMLEKVFGGENRAIKYELDKLGKIGPMKPNGLLDLANFTSKYLKYRALTHNEGQPAAFNSPLTFQRMYEVMPRLYRIEYLDHVARLNLRQDAETLLSWASAKMHALQKADLEGSPDGQESWSTETEDRESGYYKMMSTSTSQAATTTQSSR